jgi:hypothetical protein
MEYKEYKDCTTGNTEYKTISKSLIIIFWHKDAKLPDTTHLMVHRTHLLENGVL